MRYAGFKIRAFVRASLIASVAVCLQLPAEEGIAREDQLKAAYLINFAQFVQWPAADNTLTICFQGADGVREALAQAIISKKKVVSGLLAVRALAPDAATEGCKVLFIGDADPRTVSRIHSHLDKPVLTISDASGFVRNGGMIELFNQDNRLRFNINAASAARAGLQISADLLQLAAAVERGSAR